MQDKSSGREAVLYAAKSTEDKRGSIPTQLEDGRLLAERDGLSVAGEYADEAASGWSGDRGPQLAAALEHAERIGATLIVQHSDRLARGDGRRARHLVEIALWAIKANVTIRSVEDPSTFENLVMAAVMGERNTEDSRRKSAAVRAGLARRRAQGKRVGGQSYAITWRRNERDEKETVIDPEKAPVVERVFEEFLAGRPLLQIARGLNADGIPSMRGGKWHPHVVRTMLSNPLYAGLVRDGERLIDGSHEAIVPNERWEEAQALLSAKARTQHRGRDPVGPHLFRKGFLRCGECGSAMIPRSGRNKDGTLYEVYRCNGRWLDPATCSMPAQRREPIDEAVYAFFEQVGLDLEATRAQLSESIDRKIAELEALLASAEGEAQAAAARLARVKRDYVAAELTAAEWHELRGELEPEGKAARAEVARLAAQLAEVEAGPDLADIESEVLTQLAHIRAAIAGEIRDANGVTAVRAALLRLFDRFVLHKGTPDTAHIELVGDGYWIEPVISESAVEGYDDKLRPVLARKPLCQAENNGSGTLVRLKPVRAPISS